MRFLVWSGVEEWLTESCEVELGDDGLSAAGTQLGAEPVPFRVDYRLEAPERFVTIENSPLTNTMPIRRHGFQSGGSGDFVMAFVTTPSLRVEAAPQRYEHVRSAAAGSVVRYLSRDGDFTAELELDEDCLVEFYPRLARRVSPGERSDPND